MDFTEAIEGSDVGYSVSVIFHSMGLVLCVQKCTGGVGKQYLFRYRACTVAYDRIRSVTDSSGE